MIRISKISIVILFAIIFSSILPWFGSFFFSTYDSAPFTLYSPVKQTFAYIDHTTDLGIKYKDIKGNEYSEKEFNTILPAFYYRQLVMDSKFPKQICGMELSPKQIQKHNFIFKSIPRDINKPKIDLFFLLESASGRVDLEMPNDVFRLKNGIEFVDMDTNKTNIPKSKLYSEELKSKGFIFPATNAFGNPSTRKDYDEGYFLVDSKGDLFHLKRVKDKPYVHKVDYKWDSAIENVFVTEYKSHQTFAFAWDKNGDMYVIDAPNYKVTKTSITNSSLTNKTVMIIGDIFYWTIRINDDNQTRFYALNSKDYSLANSYNYQSEPNKWKEISKYIFPFEISFVSSNEKWVYPHIENLSLIGFSINMIFLALYVVLFRKKRTKTNIYLSSGVLVVLGIFAFLPLLILKD